VHILIRNTNFSWSSKRSWDCRRSWDSRCKYTCNN
jgi:hypothetical protein